MSGRLHYPPVYLGIFLLLMTSVGGALFAVAPPLQATLYTLLCGGIYAAGLHACRRYGDDQSAQLPQLANVVAGLAICLFFGSLALSGVELGLIVMLLALQAGRNLVLSSRRDLNFACLISLVLILYAAGKAMDASFMIFMVLYALAGMFTFMADHVDARLGHAQGGDRELLARAMNLPVKGVGLALVTLALAFVIYLLVPRPPSPGLHAFPSSSSWNYDNRRWEAEARTRNQEGKGGDGDGFGESKPTPRQLSEASRGGDIPEVNYAGFKSRFDIADTGDLDVRVDAIVLNLQTDNPLYVRGKVFDSFDGRSWEESRVGAGKLYDRQGRFTFATRLKAGDVRQVFTVRQELPPFIFAAYRPVLVSFPGSVIEADGSLALRTPDRLHKGTVYSVASRLAEVDKHPCSGADTGDDTGRTPDNRYLALYDGISERLPALAREVTRGADDDLERARAVESWLRDNYAYSRATMGVQWSGNPVEQFLFELKAGHCELFASSMVVMLRTLKIPSRFVTGFYVHHYNPVTGFYEIKASDGHAWVEAYLEPHGWVTFEPTSSFQLPQSKPKLFVAAGLIRYLGDRTEELIRKDRESWWAKLLQGVLVALFKFWQFIRMVAALVALRCLLLLYWFKAGGWLVMLFLVAAVVSGWYLWQIFEPSWRLARLRRAVGGEAGRFAILCYGEMERHFCRTGEPRQPHVTPLEYEQLLCRRFPELAGHVAIITRHFQQAAYGPGPLSEAEAQGALEAFTVIQGWRKQVGG